MTKAKLSLTAWISGIGAIIISIISFLLSLLVLLYSLANPSSDAFEGAIYLIFYSVFIFAAGILILFKKFKLGGWVLIVFGVLYLFGFWFLAIPLIVLGVLALKSKKIVDKDLIEIIASGRKTLQSLSDQTGVNVADIEIAVRKLEENGKVKFDPNSRQVSRK